MPYRGGNFSFVVDNSFRPYTFQEMVQPLLLYKDAFEKAEASYNDLRDKADTFKYLAEQTDGNPKAKAIYEGYAKDLETQAKDLAQHGLSMSNRRALTGLRQRYNGEIGLLAKADQARKAQIAEQQKILAQDPTRMFSREAAMTSLDDYLDNPDLSYKSYSGALLSQQVGTAASTMAKELRNGIKNGRLDSYTKTWAEQHGFTSAEVLNAIQNPDSSSAPAVLTALINDVVASSGMPKWADVATLNQAYQYARQGLWNAIGQTQMHQYEDKEAVKALEHYYHEIEADNTAKRQAALLSAQQEASNKLAINPVNIYSAKEKEQEAKDMEEYAKYFTTDAKGRTVMTKAGLDEYNRSIKNQHTITSPTGAVMRVNTGGEHDSAFKTFIDSIGGAEYARGRQVGNLGNLWNQYRKKNEKASYDATKSTEFDYTIDDSQQKGMKSAIQVALRGTELKEVDFDRSTNTFKPTGKTLSAEDLNSDKYSVVSTRFSPYGSTVMIKDDKGEVKRYKTPVGINPTNEANRDLAMQNALRIQNALNEFSQNGYYTDSKGRQVTLTQEQMVELAKRYEQELQKAYLYHSQLGVQNKTKEQEFNPYGF